MTGISSYVAVLIVIGSILQVSSGKVVCFYGSWSSYRTGNGSYDIQDIDTSLCTHVVYAFAGLDPKSYTIKSLDEWNDLPSGKNGFTRFTNHVNKLRRRPTNRNSLVKRSRGVVSMIAMGGWNEGSVQYSEMARDPAKRKNFITTLISFMERYSFKGFELDWEYPTQRGGIPQDKENFVTLLQELRYAFNGPRYHLSVAVGVGAYMIDQAYDIPKISRIVDHINLMLYDMQDPNYGITGHHASLFLVRPAIELWLSRGAIPSKLILGTAAYGRSFTLADPNTNGPNSFATGPGRPGPYTKERGLLAYMEICQMPWTVIWNTEYQAPYAYHGDQWVGFDDPGSIEMKCNLSRRYGLGGGMIWSVEMDDVRNFCKWQPNALTRALINC